MCVLIQNYQFFHVISKSVDFMQLNARNEIDWIIRQINNFTNDFFKICFFATDTCSVQKSVWKHFIKNSRLRHCFMISCDFHDFQLLIKNLFHIDDIKSIFNSIIRVVNFFKHVKHQFDILKWHQTEIYEKTYSFIAFIILRWNTQINLLKLLFRSKFALKAYVRNSDAKFISTNNFQNMFQKSTILKKILNSKFWKNVKNFLIFLKFIHDQQKCFENNRITANKIYFKWLNIRHHLIEFIVYNCHQNAVQKYLLIRFDFKFNKQIMSMHRVIYYLHFRQTKSELNQLHHIELIDFMKQHVARKHWFEMKNAFYDFWNQTKIFNISNSKWNNTDDALFFWKRMIKNSNIWFNQITDLFSLSMIFI